MKRLKAADRLYSDMNKTYKKNSHKYRRKSNKNHIATAITMLIALVLLLAQSAPPRALAAAEAFKRTGYTLIGFSESPTAEFPTYDSSFLLDENSIESLFSGDTSQNVKLYAVWEKKNYTISFNANAGAGAVPSRSARIGDTVALPGSFTRDNYNLMGFSALSSAQTAEYAGASFILNETVINELFYNDTTLTRTLYAVWSEIVTDPVPDPDPDPEPEPTPEPEPEPEPEPTTEPTTEPTAEPTAEPEPEPETEPEPEPEPQPQPSYVPVITSTPGTTPLVDLNPGNVPAGSTDAPPDNEPGETTGLPPDNGSANAAGPGVQQVVTITPDPDPEPDPDPGPDPDPEPDSTAIPNPGGGNVSDSDSDSGDISYDTTQSNFRYTKPTPEEARAEALQELKDAGVSIVSFGEIEIPVLGYPGMFVWALVNLVLCALGAVFLASTMLRVVAMKRRERTLLSIEKLEECRMFWLAVTIATGIAGVVLFLLTENTERLMVFLDVWTIAHAAIFLLEVIAMSLAIKRVTRKQLPHVQVDITGLGVKNRE